LISQELEKVLPDLVKQSTFTYIEKNNDTTDKEAAVTTSQMITSGELYWVYPVLVEPFRISKKNEYLKLQVANLEKIVWFSFV